MPIALSRKEWNRIVKWADPNKEDPEKVRRREYVKYLDETSKKMAKEWPNSLENVNKRNEQLRRERIEASEQANHIFYKKYLKRRREERQRMMYSARDTIFKHKDAPKLLLSAVVESAVLKERESQVAFRRQCAERKAAQKRADEAEVVRQAQEWHVLQEKKRLMRLECDKKQQKELLAQAAENAETKRKEYEEELNLQKLDNQRANDEIQDIKEFEEEMKRQERARIFHDMQRARVECEKRRSEAAARDRMDDRLIDLLNRSRARVQAKRQQTEKATKDERNRLLEQISGRLVSGEADRARRDQERLDKAIAQKEAESLARLERDRKKQEWIKEQRLELRRSTVQKEAENLQRQHTMRTWQMMNRFKNLEIYEDFKERERKEKERKIAEHRADLLRLWKERTEREAAETAERREFYGAAAERRLRADDNRLLVHAAALCAEARADHRPELPIRKAIDRYCRMYRLYPMPDLPESMKPHFQNLYHPHDISQPDPGYKNPPPPPPDLGPDAEDEQPATAEGQGEKAPESAPPVQQDNVGDVKVKRDGMQTLQKASPAASTSGKHPASSVDYRRKGPANGMQQKPETCVPEECGCAEALKKITGASNICTCPQPVQMTCVPGECGCAEALNVIGHLTASRNA